MDLVFLRGRWAIMLVLALSGFHLSSVRAQQAAPSQPIDLDKALAPKVAQNRALSYYYFSLAKWNEENGDLTRALTEMRNALKYNEDSSSLRVELAELLQKNGDTREALQEAEEAARLDPTDPDPHWLLANLYSRSSGRGQASKEGLRKAVKELETLRDLSPNDERSYYLLGGAYFELGEPQKAIQAFEKFQSLVTNVNDGYRAIARYYENLANQASDPNEKAQNNQKAAEYLKKAVDAQPDSTETILALATMYSRLSKDKDAVPLYQKLLELTGDNPVVKRQLAETMVEAGEYEGAGKLLEELLKGSPDDNGLKKLLGRANLGMHKNQEAIELLKSVVDSDPNEVDSLFYLGAAYEQDGQLNQAVTIFSGLLERTKNGSPELKANKTVFQQHLASDYQELGENDKAIPIYEDIIKNEATPNPRLLFFLINAYRVDRQFDKAVALGKETYEKNPQDANLGLVYARSLADAGKTKEGAEILTRLLQADPSNVDIYVNLSQIYLQGKNYAEAEKVLRRAEDRRLDSERVKFQLATIYESRKDYDRAEVLFKEIIKDNPKNANALNYIGYMLADRGVRLQEAVKYVEEALALDPNNGAYLDSLGWAFYKLNEYDKAEKYLLQAVDLVKNDPTIHDHLGDLYYKTGNYEKAREFWTKSISSGTEPEEIQKVREKLGKLEELLRKQKPR